VYYANHFHSLAHAEHFLHGREHDKMAKLNRRASTVLNSRVSDENLLYYGGEEIFSERGVAIKNCILSCKISNEFMTEANLADDCIWCITDRR
jgi:hypothetical protein